MATKKTLKIEKNAKESWTVWQKAPKGLAPQAALVVEKFADFVSIEQATQNISLNYETIDDLCKLLKQIKKIKSEDQ